MKTILLDNPKEITPCTLQVVVMPNGEIICAGQTVGYVRALGKFLTVIKNDENKKRCS
jgi:hypothetical protein